MNTDNISYEKAYAELETIINQLESDAISIELLAEKVSRAAYSANNWYLIIQKVNAGHNGT